MKFYTRTRLASSSHEEYIPQFVIANGVNNKFGLLQGGISCLKATTVIDRTRNRGFHICIVCIKGMGKFKMEDDSEFVLNPGEIFFSASNGQGHRHIPLSEDWDICWFNVYEDAAWLLDIPKDYRVSKSRYYKKIENCIRDLIDEYNTEGDSSSYLQHLQLEMLIQYLMKDLNSAQFDGKNFSYVKKFNTMWHDVSQRISERWTQEDMCKYMNLSRAQLNRLCTEIYGITPTKKITQLKMSHAHSMLKSLDYTTSEVAEAVGYESLSAFSTAFKRYFGETPSNIN